MKKVIVFYILLMFVVQLPAQSSNVRWKRKAETTSAKLQLFHSTMVANLPTAETIRKGEFEYEISHRFLPPLLTKDAYFGLDGPANMRMALAYGITNDLLATFGRSNLQDNVDLRLKYKAYQFQHDFFPFLLAFRAGLGWNTQVADRDKTDAKNFQYYGQAIFNTMLFKKVGIGFVPSYLHNSHIYCSDNQYSFTLGSYLQYFISSAWSVFVELNNTVTGYRNSSDAMTFGIDLETGGHFFKIFLTNASALNPPQYLAGADLDFLGTDFEKDWRLGFNITRVLKF